MTNRIDYLRDEFFKVKNEISFDEAISKKDDGNVKYWWRCSKYPDEDIWQTSLHNRMARDRNCPFCENQKVNSRNCLATTHPHLVKEWANENTKKPSEVVAGNSKYKVTWVCQKCNHKWPTTVNARARSNPTGCPFCAHKKASPEYNLETQYPAISEEYDVLKNGNTAKDVLPGSKDNVSWKCKKCHHEWKAEVRKRTIGNQKCPQCSKQLATLANCLARTHEHLMLEWDFEKNNISPFKITQKTASSKKIFWICPYNHSYEATIYSRTKFPNPTGCSYCSSNRVSIENSVFSDPFLKSEWDFKKNSLNIKDVALKSQKKVYWKCSKIECGFSWPATPANRSGPNKTGCPQCSKNLNKKGSSIEENRIRNIILKYFIGTYPGRYAVQNLQYKNKSPEIDIWIPELNLGIEYDPFFTHNRKFENDKEKTELLKKNGIVIIRIRQETLPKVQDSDVSFTASDTAEEMVVNLFKKIQIVLPNLSKKVIHELNKAIDELTQSITPKKSKKGK